MPFPKYEWSEETWQVTILADVTEVAIERIVDWLGAEALKAIEPDL